MDINGFKKLREREKIIKSESDPLIRIMQNDIIALEKKKSGKTISPPNGLPIIESIRGSEFKVQKEAEERAKEEAERQKEAEERVEKERIKAQKEAEERAEEERIKVRKEAEERAKEEAERQKEAEERAEEKRIKVRKEAEERAKEEAERQKEAEERAEEERIKAQKEAERQRIIKERRRKVEEIKTRLAKNAPKLIAGLVIIFLIIGTGIFFYWWNYIRIIPIAITHFECQNEQCTEIEGEGENQCQLNEDCKPIEPIVPKQLIPLHEIETIELSIEKYESFLSRLESIFRTKQEKDTFKSILIKLIKQTEKEYADFDSFVSISKINIPENIKNIITSSKINGDNYNLFLYNNGEENRVGLIISIEQSHDLVQNLNAWEETMVNDIRPLIFKNEILKSATEEFQDNTYKGVTVRYINFPTSDLSVDYAIIDNKLIITTSKDSMYAVIDTLIFVESID